MPEIIIDWALVKIFLLLFFLGFLVMFLVSLLYPQALSIFGAIGAVVSNIIASVPG